MRRPLAVALAVCMGVVGLAACGSDSEDSGGGGSTAATTASKDPITLGLAIAQTGALNATDGPSSAGLEQAVTDINAAGGIDGRQVETIYSDTRSKIEEGGRAGQEVLDKGADVVVVSCDYDYGSGAARVADQAGKIAFSLCAGSPLFGKQGIGQNAFTMGTATPTVGAAMAEFMDKQGWKRPYLLKDLTIEYSKNICDTFKETWTGLGNEIAGENTFQNDDPSISSQVSKIKASDADSIALCTFLPGGASAIKQIRAGGVTLPIVSTDGMDGDFWLKAVPNLSDFYYPTVASIFGDDPNPDVNTFVEKYTEKEGKAPPSGLATLGYGLVEVVKTAYEKAGSTEGDDMRPVLESLDKAPVLFGTQSFTPDLHFDLKRPLKILEVAAGKHKYVETIEPSNVPVPKF